MKQILLTSTILLFAIITARAQFSGQNLAEAQYGKLPSDEGDYFFTMYNRGVFNYTTEKFRASTTLELFQSPHRVRNYVNLTQASLNYRNKGFEFTAGNFYETIGHGTLLRSFQIPGAILEDISYRSRHFFHRDMLGLNGKYSYNNLTVKMLYGQMLSNSYPPTEDRKVRREDEVELAYIDYKIKKQTIGISGMRLHQREGEALYYGMGNLSGKLFPSLSYYAEVAKKLSNSTLGDFTEDASYAIYLNLNYYFERGGVSLEYKNYNQFLLGAGINEPPALVKEHTYRQLNRSTHVLQPLNEQGYQVEAFLSLNNGNMLTLNNTMAINNFGKKYVFWESFAEYAGTIKETFDYKLFIDHAQDPFKLEQNRLSTGLYTEWNVGAKHIVDINYEYQHFERSSGSIYNHFLLLGYDYSSKFGISIIGELSNDPFLTTASSKTWLGTNIKYQINPKHKLQLFVGQRRGGPACSAGVCYEVPDFNGIELRLSSRL